MMNVFEYLFSAPLGFMGTAAAALNQWIGSCFSGTCASWPQTLWDQVGTTVQSAASLVGSAGGYVWKSIFYFLPDGGAFPQVFHTSAQYFGNTLATVNFILPVDALVYCMSLVLSVKMALWALHIVQVIINFARGIPTERYSFSTDFTTVTGDDGSTRSYTTERSRVSRY